MTYPFGHTITDERTGAELLYGEYDLECSVGLDAGVPVVSVDVVYLDGKDLMRGGTLAKLIATEIIAAAEDDDAFCAKVIEDEGFVYRGLGGNDPDGRFVRVA